MNLKGLSPLCNVSHQSLLQRQIIQISWSSLTNSQGEILMGPSQISFYSGASCFGSSKKKGRLSRPLLLGIAFSKTRNFFACMNIQRVAINRTLKSPQDSPRHSSLDDRHQTSERPIGEMAQNLEPIIIFENIEPLWSCEGETLR